MLPLFHLFPLEEVLPSSEGPSNVFLPFLGITTPSYLGSLSVPSMVRGRLP